MADLEGPSTPGPTSEQGTSLLTAEQQRTIELNRLKGKLHRFFVRNPLPHVRQQRRGGERKSKSFMHHLQIMQIRRDL